jgi:hypothetical protein
MLREERREVRDQYIPVRFRYIYILFINSPLAPFSTEHQTNGKISQLINRLCINAKPRYNLGFGIAAIM